MFRDYPSQGGEGRSLTADCCAASAVPGEIGQHRAARRVAGVSLSVLNAMVRHADDEAVHHLLPAGARLGRRAS